MERLVQWRHNEFTTTAGMHSNLRVLGVPQRAGVTEECWNSGKGRRDLFGDPRKAVLRQVIYGVGVLAQDIGIVRDGYDRLSRPAA
jgi:hypothetical protein